MRQICCLTNRCGAPTNQTKVQILDHGQTTRKVNVSGVLLSSSPKQKGKKTPDHRLLLSRPRISLRAAFELGLNHFKVVV